MAAFVASACGQSSERKPDVEPQVSQTSSELSLPVKPIPSIRHHRFHLAELLQGSGQHLQKAAAPDKRLSAALLIDACRGADGI